MAQAVDGHEAQRFQAPTDIPEPKLEGYQARLVRAQRGYQAEADSPWDGEVTRNDDAAEVAAEQSQPSRASDESGEPKRGLMRWLRRRGKRAEHDDDEVEVAEPARRASDDHTEPEAPQQ